MSERPQHVPGAPPLPQGRRTNGRPDSTRAIVERLDAIDAALSRINGRLDAMQGQITRLAERA